MIGKSIALAVLAVLMMTTPSLAMGGGGGGGGFSGSPPVDLLLPDPPRNVSATAGNSMATVNFERPKSDGGNRITGYTVISHPEGMRATGKESPITLRGLTNGKEYTFTVSASNSVGTGVASPPSNCVTPRE